MNELYQTRYKVGFAKLVHVKWTYIVIDKPMGFFWLIKNDCGVDSTMTLQFSIMKLQIEQDFHLKQ